MDATPSAKKRRVRVIEVNSTVLKKRGPVVAATKRSTRLTAAAKAPGSGRDSPSPQTARTPESGKTTKRHPGAARSVPGFVPAKYRPIGAPKRPRNDPSATIPVVLPPTAATPSLWKSPRTGPAVSAPVAPLGQSHPPARPRRSIVLTPITLRIETLITRMAAAGHALSSNVIIAGVLHGPGRETVRRSVERLIAAGRILIETKPGFRRATVIATGQTTGWGAFVTTGHAPFSLNPRGSTPSKPIRPYTRVAGEVFRFRITPQRLVETRPAESCQWIADMRLSCEAPSVRGHSWCLDHGVNIYPSWKRKFAKAA